MADFSSISHLSIPYDWPAGVVSGWLIEVGLQDYVKIFREKKIDGRILLTDKCTKTLQQSLIPDQNDRHKFILALADLKSHLQINTSDIQLDRTATVNTGASNSSNDEHLARQIAEEQLISISTIPQSHSGRKAVHTTTGPTTTTANAQLTSWNYTLSVNRDDTLNKIAKEKDISIEELLAANPTLPATQKLDQGQIIFLPFIQHLIEDKAVGVSPKDTSIVPDAFDDEDLQDYKEHMHTFFTIFDANQNDRLNVKEFESLLHHLNLNTLDDTQIKEIYCDINDGNDAELTFENMFQYLRSIIIIEADLSPPQFCLFQAMLSADHLNQCVLGGITQFLNRSWTTFSQYRRFGQNGQVVMLSGDNIAVHNEGTYSLLDLICWSDRLADMIQPVHAVIKGFQWRSKSELGSDAKTGELIFPSDFNRVLPTEIATSQTLKYYGCCFANETQLKVSLLHRHEIEDFEYLSDYFNEFVLSINQPALERHGFAHLDCPHDHHTKSGRFVLGKIVNGNELHLTAFQIPAKHTLYVPPNTIHSNDYLRGKWRTMLAVADIDRVVLKRQRIAGNLSDIFSFDFS